MDLLPAEITVNEKCQLLIKQAGKQYNTIAVLYLLLSAVTLLIDVGRLYQHLQMDFKEWYEIFNYKIYYFLIVIYAFITCIQMYYYYKGIKLQNKAIENFEQDSFDLSFSYYVSGNKFSIISMCLYIPMEIIVLYQDIFIY